MAARCDGDSRGVLSRGVCSRDELSRGVCSRDELSRGVCSRDELSRTMYSRGVCARGESRGDARGDPLLRGDPLPTNENLVWTHPPFLGRQYYKLSYVILS